PSSPRGPRPRAWPRARSRPRAWSRPRTRSWPGARPRARPQPRSRPHPRAGVAARALRAGDQRRHHPVPGRAGGAAERAVDASRGLRPDPDRRVQRRTGRRAGGDRHPHGLRAPADGALPRGRPADPPLAAADLIRGHDAAGPRHRGAGGDAVDTSLAAALGVGFTLGLRHALEADHVAAVSTFVSQERGLLRSCLRGAFWGLGHTIALMAAGLAIVAFKLEVSPAFERTVDTVVALVLILLGGHVLFRAIATFQMHRHEHAHDGSAHRHLHVHVGDDGTHGHLHPWRGARQPLLMGLLHGLAGGGALVLLVMATIPS